MVRQAFAAAYGALPGAVRDLLETEFVRQLIRFGVSGASAVLLSVSVYLLLVYGADRNPFVATAFSHLAGLGAAYLLHSRWSFAGDQQGTEVAKIGRYLVVTTLCYGLNNLWVAVTTLVLDFPMWAPVPLMVFVTPLVSFVLNRLWVFRRPPLTAQSALR